MKSILPEFVLQSMCGEEDVSDQARHIRDAIKYEETIYKTKGRGMQQLVTVWTTTGPSGSPAGSSGGRTGPPVSASPSTALMRLPPASGSAFEAWETASRNSRVSRPHRL